MLYNAESTYNVAENIMTIAKIMILECIEYDTECCAIKTGLNL